MRRYQELLQLTEEQGNELARWAQSRTNNAASPSLVVDGLKGADLHGGIALWGYANQESYFSNLRITPAAAAPVQNGSDAAGVWEVSYASDYGRYSGARNRACVEPSKGDQTMTKLNDLHQKWMKNKEYRKAHEELAAEFELARAVIEARAVAGLTQEQLAKRMDTTQSVLAHLEGGRSRPSIQTLERLAAATGTRLKISFEPAPTGTRGGRRKTVSEPRPPA